MKTYERAKAEARAKAIEFQQDKKSIPYLELYRVQQYFLKIGKRYGLIKEFKENGVI